MTRPSVVRTRPNVVVIDGQGGKMGQTVIAQLRAARVDCAICAVGTNSIATANMLKAGADHGATGENPVVVACRDADFIVGPIGIVIADALVGEVTPAMAAAVGRSRAERVLLPVNRCGTYVVGTQELPMAELIAAAVAHIAAALNAP